jgi:hypothetical protein
MKEKNLRIAYYTGALAVMIFGVAYASVPLYKGNNNVFLFTSLYYDNLYTFLQSIYVIHTYLCFLIYIERIIFIIIKSFS